MYIILLAIYKRNDFLLCVLNDNMDVFISCFVFLTNTSRQIGVETGEAGMGNLHRTNFSLDIMAGQLGAPT